MLQKSLETIKEAILFGSLDEVKKYEDDIRASKVLKCDCLSYAVQSNEANKVSYFLSLGAPTYCCNYRDIVEAVNLQSDEIASMLLTHEIQRLEEAPDVEHDLFAMYCVPRIISNVIAHSLIQSFRLVLPFVHETEFDANISSVITAVRSTEMLQIYMATNAKHEQRLGALIRTAVIHRSYAALQFIVGKYDLDCIDRNELFLRSDEQVLDIAMAKYKIPHNIPEGRCKHGALVTKICSDTTLEFIYNTVDAHVEYCMEIYRLRVPAVLKQVIASCISRFCGALYPHVQRSMNKIQIQRQNRITTIKMTV